MSCDGPYRVAPPPALVSLPLHRLLSGEPTSGVVAGSGSAASYLTFSAEPHDVVAVVGPDGVLLPIAIHVAELPPLAVGEPALIGAGVLTVGLHTWRAARWWDPRPRVTVSALVDQAQRLLPLVADGSAQRIGLDAERAQGAVTGLVSGNAGAAVSILGGGPGFTPAGDDVVAGALAALAVAESLDPVVAEQVLEAAADHTTAVSAALLASATRGEVLPQAASVLHALAAGAGDDVLDAAAASLRSVGSTSGHALLFGMAHALASAARLPAGATETETT